VQGSHAIRVRKFPGVKRSVRRCVVVMNQPVLLSRLSLRTFSRSRLKRTQQFEELTVWPSRKNYL
jgi:hypothetical protein